MLVFQGVLLLVSQSSHLGPKVSSRGRQGLPDPDWSRGIEGHPPSGSSTMETPGKGSSRQRGRIRTLPSLTLERNFLSSRGRSKYDRTGAGFKILPCLFWKLHQITWCWPSHFCSRASRGNRIRGKSVCVMVETIESAASGALAGNCQKRAGCVIHGLSRETLMERLLVMFSLDESSKSLAVSGDPRKPGPLGEWTMLASLSTLRCGGGTPSGSKRHKWSFSSSWLSRSWWRGFHTSPSGSQSPFQVLLLAASAKVSINSFSRSIAEIGLGRGDKPAVSFTLLNRSWSSLSTSSESQVSKDSLGAVRCLLWHLLWCSIPFFSFACHECLPSTTASCTLKSRPWARDHRCWWI